MIQPEAPRFDWIRWSVHACVVDRQEWALPQMVYRRQGAIERIGSPFCSLRKEVSTGQHNFEVKVPGRTLHKFANSIPRRHRNPQPIPKRDAELQVPVSGRLINYSDLFGVELICTHRVKQTANRIRRPLATVRNLWRTTEPGGPVTEVLLDDDVGEGSHIEFGSNACRSSPIGILVP